MTLTEIYSMAADALAGEELQFFKGEKWRTDYENYAFHHAYAWRIKPTIEVNGVLMSKRQAKAEWEESGATNYEFSVLEDWVRGRNLVPDFCATSKYRWVKPKWIYVNGVAIVPEGGNARSWGYCVANESDGVKLRAAIYALVEVK